MANANTANGFQYLRGCDPFRRSIASFIKLVGVGTGIAAWDVVHEVAGSSLSDDKGAIEPFGTGTPGTTVPLGVALSQGAASTRTRHHVIVDPAAEYHAADDGDTDGIGYADLNKNANVNPAAFTSIASTQYKSGHTIDESSINTAAARDLRIFGRYQLPTGNDIGSNYVRGIVRFNTSRHGGGTVAGV